MRRLILWAVVVGGLMWAHGALAETRLHWASALGAQDLDPHGAVDEPTLTILAQIYDTLVQRTPGMALEAGLATSWSAKDSTTWQFTLRPGVTFHDGSPFSADDVVFSIQRAQAPGSALAPQLETIIEVLKIDDLTVEVWTDRPWPLLPEHLAQVFILSKSWAETHGLAQIPDPANPAPLYTASHANGTGAFKLAHHEAGTRTLLVRNDDWWDRARHAHGLDWIDHRPVAKAEERRKALLAQTTDLVTDLPSHDLLRIRKTSTLTVETGSEARTIFLGLRQRGGPLQGQDEAAANPFADRRVREAVYRAINLEAIRRAIMHGLAQPAGRLLPPGTQGYDGTRDTRLDFDLDAAKALLADAGFEQGFAVRFDCPKGRYANDEAICRAVTNMLGRLGLKVDLSIKTPAEHFSRIRNREVDFFLFGWQPARLDGAHLLDGLYRSYGLWNAARYADPRVDTLLEAAALDIDRESRKEKLSQVWDIVTEDIVYIPLHHQVIGWAHATWFTLPVPADGRPRFHWVRPL